METKSFMSVFFSCAMVIIFVVAIESSKDEKQFGETKEFQNKIGFDCRKPWTTWHDFPNNRRRGKGGKKVEIGSCGTGSIGKNGEEGAQGGSEQNGGEIDIGIKPEGEQYNKIKGLGVYP
ncbi:uncharacterized protein LOC131638828 [Vicia villosa]|uniref:uncharacterized protein LOC131617201 n=1 Tax=Vicia villosa TaxID=3911 RepID=UPI00273B32B8|nr:uncharacterized protein LOC131617201 [Vicia villosa]XP_058765360.1 uncharacterized protein LOC131638828 [Vicia villosa]